MFKYRRLTLGELEQLKESFIRFLAANSVTADNWEEIKKQDEIREDELIDQFSDVVIEKTLHNIKILEQRTKDRIVFYQFFDTYVSLMGLEMVTENQLDFREAFSMEALYGMLKNPKIDIDFLSGTKKYSKEKLQEIFEILNQGCSIVRDDYLFNFLIKIFDEFK